MSTIRLDKHSKGFVILDTTCLNDTRLSFRARGLHAYLISKPDDWTIAIAQLDKQSEKEGREAIRTAVNELVQYGYAKRVKSRNPHGLMAGSETVIYEKPPTIPREPDKPQPDKPTWFMARSETVIDEEPPTIAREPDKPTVGFPDSRINRPSDFLPPTKDCKKLGLREERQQRIEADTPSIPPQGEARTKARRKKAPNTAYTPGFEQVFSLWPPGRKEGKVATFAIWQERGLEPRAQEIADKVERLTITLWEDRETRHIPLPKTWFDDARYEDDLAPLSARPHGLTPKEYRTIKNAYAVMEDLKHDDDVNRSPTFFPRALSDGRDVQ